ncbi:hypothetical protein PENTCL1PPCAC_27505 [Pristionchus entomophagus]|uniref:Uncharacterized protein n=1 Tax=Pristionchus entomophagus TaxID=358040 RepID=A0AAV5UFT8_9BILA|nr:hypothetical protein PENTCL1PPCAC_27505 [Pristionchus entomophagus]
MSTIIPRNTVIPTTKSETYVTCCDNQDEVYVGRESKVAKHNNLLGEFTLSGIPPAPSGVPQIEVTFDIDANGILNVSAKEKSTGIDGKITVSSSQAKLTKDEIDKMAAEMATTKV